MIVHDMQRCDGFTGSGKFHRLDLSSKNEAIANGCQNTVSSFRSRELTFECPSGLGLLSNRTSHHIDAVYPTAPRVILKRDLRAKNWSVKDLEGLSICIRKC